MRRSRRQIWGIGFVLLVSCITSCQKEKIEENRVKQEIVESDLGFAEGEKDYLTTDEYFLLHPEEKERSAKFAKRIRNPALPLRTRARLSRPVRIAMIYPGKQVSDYWRRSQSSFEARMKEANIPYKITSHYTDPKSDLRSREEVLERSLESNPDYLVFNLDAQKHKKVLGRILPEQRPRLILQNITTPLKNFEDKPPFLYVGFDHLIGTQILAEHVLQETRLQARGAKYAVLFYKKGYVSEMRGESFMEIMRERSDMKLAGQYYTEGSREKARLAALDALKDPEVKLIYACSSDVAVGAADAIREMGRTGEVLVNGWGGGSKELELLRKGELSFTVMRINDDNGAAMADAIQLALEGKETEVPTISPGNFSLITQKTTARELDDLTRRAFRYSDPSP